MGQGYSLITLPAASAGIDVPEMADIAYEKSLGNARFMKCIRARHKNGLVIAKVVMKPYPQLRLDEYVKVILAERKLLAEIPNALAYHRVIETRANGYLVRQFIHSSLYDRLSTRPFLEDIEKKWIAFQLLSVVRDCHAHDIYHGDIKSENILVTSWNWLYLTDFSSAFKPTYLPEDNPADFSFFFDTSGRRTCYLAPERFLRPGEDATGRSPINWAMDIFSVGCVIAELFLEAPIFNLSQLFKYRQNKAYDPVESHISRITDKDIREMVSHMIHVDPQSRYSAEEYLTFWKGKAFPDYFYSFLHQYMHLITDSTSGQSPITSGAENLGEADDRIDRVYNDFDKISYFLGYPNSDSGSNLASSQKELFPLLIDIPNNRHEASVKAHRPSDDGTLIFVTIIVSAMRNTARAAARVRACELLLAFGERVTDESKLDRILPYLMSLLSDKADIVRVTAIRTITQLLALVTVVSPTNSYIFPEYILPKLQPFSSNTNSKVSPWVRATYASCLGSLASSASHFLECQQMLKSRTNVPFDMEGGSISRSSYQSLFDLAREDLISQFETHAKALLTDPDVSVRRSLLPSVAMLCVFFGNQKAGDVVLGHLNTYLNDNDWLLKSDFFERIVGVAAYIGTSGLEEFILPLMVQSLTDPEEAVVEKVIRSFTAIADLGIFHRPSLWELVEIVARFTMHPNIWIREAAARFISAAAKYASIADRSAIITPLIKDYMTVLPAELTESVVLDCLKKSLPRLTLEMASSWAAKDGSGGFWNTAANGQLFVFGFGDGLQIAPAKPSNAKILNRLAKSDEDESWVKRLRHAGMTAEDEIKLVALQEYIWRSTRRRNQETVEKETPAAGIIPLKDLDVSLQLVFFDNQKAAQQVKAYEREEAAKLRTIAEALQDATSTSTAPDRQATGPRDIPGTVLSPTDSQPHSPIERVLGSPNPEVSSLDSRLSLRVDRPITRKGSAINLMLGNNRDAAAKATAEISTDTTNVFGKVENRQHKADEAKKHISPLVRAHDNRLTVSGRPLDPVHTYIGSDPTVLKLLDSLYADNYPLDLIEFGQITPLQRTEPRRRGAQAPAIWRPEGALVALLAEHTAPINRVAIAPDHRFFITGSDDGTVRVWDSGRLERNVSQRSRLVHPQGHDVRVTALTFVRGTHCFASGGSDGSVHVVRVDCTDAAQSSSSSAAAASMAAGAAAGGGAGVVGPGGGPAAGTRYTRMSLVRKHQLPAGEHAVWLEHHHTESASTLLVATNASAVHGVDLRTMATAFTLRCPPRHGAPTCLCVDRAGQWLLVGTARGALHLWDLRFRLRLRSWRFEAGGAIHKLVAPALRGSRKFRVAVAGGAPGCVAMLDVERGVIKQVFRTPPGAGNTEEPPPAGRRSGARQQQQHQQQQGPPVPVLIDLDEEDVDGAVSPSQLSTDETADAEPPPDLGVRAIAVGAHVLDESVEPRHAYVVGAGPDWRVRFWEGPGMRGEGSCVVSGGGSSADDDAATVAPSTYEIKGVGDAVVVEEVPGKTTTTEGSESEAGGKKARAGKGTIVSLLQQDVLSGHKDTVLDVALLERPYGMIVSVDRAGVAYVFC